MEPISGLTALYEILRRKTGGKSESTGRTAKETREPGRGPMEALGERNAHSVQLADLELQIRARLKEQPRDALMSPASKRWVIASLLSWEFDPRLQNEPKFNALVRNVQQSIDGDARLKAKFERVMEQLSR